MKLIDGLPDIFTGTFGEPVVYTPAGEDAEPLQITAIWIESHVPDVLGEVASDSLRVELHLRRADVPSPAEGDLVQRVETGRTMKVVPPIRPDDQGMIAVTLAEYEAPPEP
jgi:hypothetical protein